MIHIITALACEAKPLTEHFQLQRDSRPGLFKRYISKDQLLSLTLSGAGRLNAAAAVTETHHYYPGRHAWLNIGTAGHAHHPLGSGFLIGKLSCRSSASCWYPSILFKPPLPITALISLEQPLDDYCEALYDMEAAGFYAIASRVSLHELIACIKIVSDNRENTIDKIDKSLINKLILNRIPEIEQCLIALKSLQVELPSVDISEQFNLLTKQAHFTTYQKNRLRSLLWRWQVLMQQQPSDILDQQADAGQILARLAHHLDQQPISYYDR